MDKANTGRKCRQRKQTTRNGLATSSGIFGQCIGLLIYCLVILHSTLVFHLWCRYLNQVIELFLIQDWLNMIELSLLKARTPPSHYKQGCKAGDFDSFKELQINKPRQSTSVAKYYTSFRCVQSSEINLFELNCMRHPSHLTISSSDIPMSANLGPSEWPRIQSTNPNLICNFAQPCSAHVSLQVESQTWIWWQAWPLKSSENLAHTKQLWQPMSLIFSTLTSCHPTSCSGPGFCSSVGEKQLSLATRELENATALRHSADSMDTKLGQVSPWRRRCNSSGSKPALSKLRTIQMLMGRTPPTYRILKVWAVKFLQPLPERWFDQMFFWHLSELFLRSTP